MAVVRGVPHGPTRLTVRRRRGQLDQGVAVVTRTPAPSRSQRRPTAGTTARGGALPGAPDITASPRALARGTSGTHSPPHSPPHTPSRDPAHTPPHDPARPTPRGRGAHGVLWAGLALAAGLFLAPVGWPAWAGAALLVTAGLAGLGAYRPWARTALWTGLGAIVGVTLHLAVQLLHPDVPGLVPFG